VLTRAALRRRLRRLNGERGFSLLETVIAITVIFGSLTALAYTATIGFDYTAVARERQSATAIASKIMEEARGIPYSDIQQGLRLSSLAADTNTVTGCGGDPAGTYRFLQCAAGSNGTGDKIVYASGANAAPLADSANSYKHEGTISDRGITYTWRIYVTNNDAVNNPYRVTVLLTWTSGATSQLKTYRTQSLFYSPKGCTGFDAHPFAAPCQPFFYGLATAQQPTVTVSGFVEGLDFDDASISSVGVEGYAQIEQTSTMTADFSTTGITLTNSGGAQAFEGTASTLTADDDPTDGDQSNPVPLTLSSGNGSFLEEYDDDTGYRVDDPSGESAQAAAVNNAGGANVCPPSPAVAETDDAPCAGARAQQAGTLTSVLHPHDIDPDLNDATIARIGAMGNPSTAFVDREADTPPADGRVEQSVTRRVGTVNVGGLPPGVTEPAGWLGGNAWNGYLMTLTGYQDTISAQAGSSAAAPTATVNSGTLYYWNGTGYSSVTATAGIPYADMFLSETIGGHNVEVYLETDTFSPAAASVTSSPSGGGSITRNDVSATVLPPMRGTIYYTIWVDGAVVVDLSIDVNLGTVLAQGVYEPAPVAA
jgi:type II secretory pathway pseudopilin PulG